MKLAEALMKRKDLLREINRIREEISNTAVVREDVAISINLEQKVEKLAEKEKELMELNIKIDKANKEFLLEEINKIRVLDASISFWKNVRDTVLRAKDQLAWASKEARYRINLDLDQINNILETLELERRNIDRYLQKQNWQIDID